MDAEKKFEGMESGMSPIELDECQESATSPISTSETKI